MAILAILAGIAIRRFDGLDQQARFDATRRAMQNIDDAILATGREADGSLSITGFIADVGRLPQAFGADPNSQLAELWSNPRNLAPFAVQTSPADPQVLIACGWRGNYLRLGVGQSTLQDGWGNAFDLLKSDMATAAGNGDAIAAVRSRGADGTIDTGPTTGYDADITLMLGGTGSSTSQGSQGSQGGTATISGNVYQFDATTGQLGNPDTTKGDVTIMFFGPNPSTGLVLDPPVSVTLTYNGSAWVVKSYVGQQPTVTPTGTMVSFSFVGTAGPRVIRAYQGTPATPGNWSTAPVLSVPVRVMLQPGGQTKDLTLR
jgi:type II secretory pathway pseudopilin PulG